MVDPSVVLILFVCMVLFNNFVYFILDAEGSLDGEDEEFVTKTIRRRKKNKKTRGCHIKYLFETTSFTGVEHLFFFRLSHIFPFWLQIFNVVKILK